MEVIKRDGKRVAFDVKKIERVIGLANKAVSADKRIDDEKVKMITEKVVSKIENKDEVEVEEIQDLVEQFLLQDKKAYFVGKEFSRCREERAKERFKRLDIMKRIKEKLEASDVQNQNANVDEHSFGGRKGEADGELMKQLALDYYISPKFAKNHLNNRIYIHDLDNYVVGMHNCAIRSERFVTSDGVRSFEDFNDGEDVIVLNKDGKFVPATVKCFGRQPMQEITFTNGNRTVVKVFTKDHRWILEDGSVTTNLSVGDKLYKLPAKLIGMECITSKRDAEMFALGFVIGDGCDYKDYINVRLCGDRAKYRDIFTKAGYSVKQEFENDKVFSKKTPIGKQNFLTNKVWKMLTLKDKQMLFAGYYAADGNNNALDISTTDERCVELIKDISALCGYHVYDVSEKVLDTNYKKDAHIWTIRFNNPNDEWAVTDIQKGNHRNPDYEAWCIVEPDTHSFVLDGGLVTGNCLSVPFDHLLRNGFNTRQTDIRPANSINTAFQLVAVLFQLQSLQEFGGVSATHIDWTMVPYVRKSFWKHYMRQLASYNYYLGSEEPMPVDKAAAVSTSIDSKLYKVNKKVYDMAMLDTVQEAHQAVEGMYHNLNTLQSRSGNQLPFTSINYGTCTLSEGRLIIKALLDASIDGVGKLHKTAIFPCGIFQKMKGVNDKGSKNYDLYKLAIKSTSKRLYPNYANVDWTNNDDSKSYALKEDYLNSLSDEKRDKLILMLKENPSLQEQLGLELEEEK